MIDRPWAEAFAHEWLANWNARDLDALLSHYTTGVVFRSPRISIVIDESKTFVTGVVELRDYWQKALGIATELHFEISHVLVGSDALTILYRNHRDQEVAETLVFDKARKIIEGIVTCN
jgi:ketosteroid isomerase-like protein